MTEPTPTASVPIPPPPLATAPGERYPMRFDVEYSESLSRLSTAFRFILVIPVFVLSSIIGYVVQAGIGFGLLSVFFRRKYPGWLFTGVQGALAWQARAGAYYALQTDQFPTLNPQGSPVTLEYDTPPEGELSRWRVLVWKAILLIPQLIVLSILFAAAFVVVFLAWWAILFTGRYPRGLFGFVTGVQRWYFRVVGYFASFNDRFPPFALSADAGPAANTTVVVCGVIGAIVGPLIAAAIIAAVVIASQEDVVEVDYDDLQAGISSEPFCYTGDFSDDPSLCVTLMSVDDPASQADLPLLEAEDDERFIVFNVAVFTARDGELLRGYAAFTLRYEEDGEDGTTPVAPQLVTINGRAEPRHVDEGDSEIIVVFLIPEDAEPVSLRFTPPIVPVPGLRFEFD